MIPTGSYNSCLKSRFSTTHFYISPLHSSASSPPVWLALKKQGFHAINVKITLITVICVLHIFVMLTVNFKIIIP